MQGANVTQLSPSDDSWVDSDYAGSNYGASTTLKVKSNHTTGRAYLKFDLEDMPAGKVITSVKLYLYCTYAWPPYNLQVNVHETGDSWTEGSITWNNAPAVGALVASNTTVGGTGKYYSWDMTSYAQGEYSGDKILSVVVKFLLDDPTENNPNYRKYFGSKESDGTSNDPYLEIVYSHSYPSASFTHSPSNPVANETVTFNASDSYDPDGYIANYEWDFGDGNITSTTDPIINHSYTLYGNYTVALVVTDNDGLNDSETTLVEVLDPATLEVSLPAGVKVGYNSDPWLYKGWLLNETSSSWNFVVKVKQDSCRYKSYDTHLIVALNNAGYDNLVSLTIDGTTIPKSAFQYGRPKPYGVWSWPWWEKDVYETWFDDTYINLGTIGKKQYKTVSVNVTFLDPTGARMHFDAYGKTREWCGEMTYSPTWKDSTVQCVVPAPKPPHAAFTYSPPYPQVCETVTFNATDSYDPDGWIVNYTWDFGDGNVNSTTDPIITHHYTTNGSYTVVLTVTDNDDLTDSETDTVNVRKRPVASFTYSPSEPLVDETVTFDASASTPNGGYINWYEWDFGDGNETGSTDPIITHGYNASGNYNVTLTVFDSEGMSDATWKWVNVTAPPPPLSVSISPTSFTMNLGQSVTFTSNVSGGTPPYSYQWYLDDTAVSGANTSSWTFTPTSAGFYTVYLNVCDSADCDKCAISNTANVTVQPPKYYLTVETDPADFVTIPGEGWYVNCTYVTLTAPLFVPNETGVAGQRYRFDNWTVNGEVFFTLNITVHMDANHTATAHYVKQYYLTVSSPYGTPSGEGWYDSGDTAYADLDVGTVDHGNGTRRVFTQWGGDASGTNYAQSNSITMDGPKTAIANWKTQYYLTVSSDHGTPGGEGWYNASDTAYATITPLTVAGPAGVQYIFTGWSGDALGSSSPSDPITMDGPKTAVANWKTQYLVTFDQTGLDSNATGTVVTVNGSAKIFGDLPFTWWVDNCSWVEYSYSVIVSSLDPNENFTLINVTGPVSPFHVGSPVTVTGNYRSVYKVQYYLGVTSNYGTSGGMGWYDDGDTAYATLDTGIVDHLNGTRRVFTHWSGDAFGTDYAQSDPIIMDGNKTAIANWKTQYYLTMSTNFGTVSPGSGWHDAGTSVEINATAPTVVLGERYVWNGWTGTGSDSYTGTDNPASITMNGPITETASWTHQYRLTMATNYGTTNPSVGDHWYEAGSTVEINATAPSVVTGERYFWLGWTGTGTISYTGTDNPATITMDSPITETASWTHQYYLTLATSPPGVTTPSGEGWYDAGTYASISTDEFVDIVPGASRYRFDGWTTADMPEIADPSATSTTVLMDKAKTVTANYVTQYYLTVKTDPAGLSPAPTPPSNWYDDSTDVTLTAKTVPGYTFLNWDVDGTSQGNDVNPITVHMNQPHTATAHYQYEGVCPPVGGVIISMNKIAPAPWIVLVSAILSTLVVVVLLTKCRSRKAF